ncbi:hypothetical protein [Actinomyces polynesiensis]|uniref:hypothetical protein n=1 Tax=Actinomyces polynesiensis TaxID=1325934 RepID=UPI00093B3A41|nr:hypothetical protein [Actinomyces polynesiensis]
MFAITVDQRRSRHGRDLVPEALRALGRAVPGPVLPFERTVGDEIQALLATGSDVVEACRCLLRNQDWHVGIGIGPVELPLPGSTREARGEAFIEAREAVEEAKSLTPSLRVLGAGTTPDRVGDADVVLRLLASVWTRRTAAGWDAVDAVEATRDEDGPRLPLREVAARLDITQQALSQRLRTASWQLEVEALPLAARLLDGAGTGAGGTPAAGTPEPAGGRGREGES